MIPDTSHIPCDLLANFLTHSYLNVLEKYLYYIKHPNDSDALQGILQATGSFLFIFSNNPHASSLLDSQIFTYYMPSTSFTTSKSQKKQTLVHSRKAYTKTLRKLPASHSYATANKKLIHHYYDTLFSQFTTPPSLPPLFRADNAQTFVSEVKKLRFTLLKTPL
ncbi:MAG: hypothetical protein ACRCWY_00585 [Cellulosilyticaceae bacterium]